MIFLVGWETGRETFIVLAGRITLYSTGRLVGGVPLSLEDPVEEVLSLPPSFIHLHMGQGWWSLKHPGLVRWGLPMGNFWFKCCLYGKFNSNVLESDFTRGVSHLRVSRWEIRSKARISFKAKARGISAENSVSSVRMRRETGIKSHLKLKRGSYLHGPVHN